MYLLSEVTSVRGDQTIPPPWGTGSRKANHVVAVALAAMVGCGGGGAGEGISLGSLPDTSCTSADTWVARGFQYDHFADSGADTLLTATLRRGEVVPLRVTTHRTTGCDDEVASVQWRSTSADVAALTPTSRLESDLAGLRPGETTVSAEVILDDGSRVTAELYAVPQEGSPLLRVYTVRVVR